MALDNNQLTGALPPELGQLANLTYLILYNNQLIGAIPSELGQLANLISLNLADNQLSGPIPIELGQLANLISLNLADNQLSGPIPAELGQLERLTRLILNSNQLSSPIPTDLGQLSMLEQLRLSHNRLSGNIPVSLGDLAGLRSLGLTDNADMSGVLPLTLTNLVLEELLLGGTQLCASSDPGFQDWLRSIPISRVAVCDQSVGGSTTYLTQATQSFKYPVPLVAGEDALLRVFITADSDLATMPYVRATFYESSAEVHVVEIPGTETPIPREIEEGNLSVTADALIPGSIITPGLEMVVYIDPNGELDQAEGVPGRLPPEGRIPIDVVSLPPFELTLVPFLGTEFPDESFLAQVNGLSGESHLFRLTRDILPVADFVLDVYEPQWISGDVRGTPWTEIFRLIKMISTMEGGTGHYMGVMRLSAGWADLAGRVSLAPLDDYVIAHELGHNLNLGHAPCDTQGDPDYPYPDGTIGAWGCDLLEGRLVDPSTPDLMGYCDPPQWISEYHFKKAMAYRLTEARETPLASAFAPSMRSLLLWGGVESDGELVLEPAYVVDATPSLPQSNGPYRITGVDQDGRIQFSLSFDMPEVADAEEVKTFAFILPVQRDWRGNLERVTLSGPEGTVTLGDDGGEDGEEGSTATLLLDPVTGQVRGLLRDWPEPGTSVSAASARRTLPEPGLEVLISSGIPDPTDW